MARSWDFGPSLMTEEAIKALEDEGCFPIGKGHPLRGEAVPQPEVDEAVVFKDFLLVAFAYLQSISFAWYSRLLRYSSTILLPTTFLHLVSFATPARHMALPQIWVHFARIMKFSVNLRRRRLRRGS